MKNLKSKHLNQSPRVTDQPINSTRSCCSHTFYRITVQQNFEKNHRFSISFPLWIPLVSITKYKCYPFPANLVTLTKEILNGKLHFLCSATNNCFCLSHIHPSTQVINLFYWKENRSSGPEALNRCSKKFTKCMEKHLRYSSLFRDVPCP